MMLEESDLKELVPQAQNPYSTDKVMKFADKAETAAKSTP